MTDSDSERLITEALKARAGQSGGVPVHSIAPEKLTDRLPNVSGDSSQSVVGRSGFVNAGEISAGWILLLATALGLATGAVVGLLTVL